MCEHVLNAFSSRDESVGLCPQIVAGGGWELVWVCLLKQGGPVWDDSKTSHPLSCAEVYVLRREVVAKKNLIFVFSLLLTLHSHPFTVTL